jgi:DNA modification methylase
MIVLNEQGTPQLNTVHHCRAEALLSALDTGSVDLVVTSPPYDNLRTYNGFSWNFEYIAQQTYRVLKSGGVLVWVVGDATVNGCETLTSFEQALYFKKSVGFAVETMIWDKAKQPGLYGKRYEQVFEYMFVCSKGEPTTFNPIMVKSLTAGTKRKASNRKDGYNKTEKIIVVNERKIDANIWYVPTGYGQTSTDGTADHPAMFPEALAERHILTWSNAGDVVLDFFGGSGTTAKMARKNGRDYLTCDISREYCDLMTRRLSIPYTLDMFAARPA